MIISDLSHLETIVEDTAIIGGTAVQVVAKGTAYGDSSFVSATATISTKELPHNGSIAKGKASIVALASDPVDATAAVYLSGAAEGTITVFNTQTNSVDNGTSAKAISHMTVIAITPPSPF
jgi:hypothetical protein